jgi:hypothetical protein
MSIVPSRISMLAQRQAGRIPLGRSLGRSLAQRQAGRWRSSLSPRPWQSAGPSRLSPLRNLKPAPSPTARPPTLPPVHREGRCLIPAGVGRVRYFHVKPCADGAIAAGFSECACVQRTHALARFPFREAVAGWSPLSRGLRPSFHSSSHVTRPLLLLSFDGPPPLMAGIATRQRRATSPLVAAGRCGARQTGAVGSAKRDRPSGIGQVGSAKWDRPSGIGLSGIGQVGSAKRDRPSRIGLSGIGQVGSA